MLLCIGDSLWRASVFLNICHTLSLKWRKINSKYHTFCNSINAVLSQAKKKKILCSHGKIKFYPHAYLNIIFLLFVLSLNVHISPNSHLWIWISFCLNFLFSCDIYFPLWLSSLVLYYLVSYFHIWFQIKFIVIFILPFLTIIRHYFGYFQLTQLPWKTWE